MGTAIQSSGSANSLLVPHLYLLKDTVELMKCTEWKRLLHLHSCLSCPVSYPQKVTESLYTCPELLILLISLGGPRRGIASPVAIRRGEGAQRKRCRDPRCSPPGACGHIIPVSAAAAAKSLQSCPTLCYPRDGSPPGSPIPEILQAKTLELVVTGKDRASCQSG